MYMYLWVEVTVMVPLWLWQLWFELKANDIKGLCKLMVAKIQNINQGYWWNIDLVNVSTTTKTKKIMFSKTYFDLAPMRQCSDRSNDSLEMIAME